MKSFGADIQEFHPWFLVGFTLNQLN